MRVPVRKAKKKVSNPGKWQEFDFIIGIDPGVNTGFASFANDTKHPALTVSELPIWKVFEALTKLTSDRNHNVYVVLEDARKTRRPKGVSLEESEAKKMGAGWIRTLSATYERFLIAHGIPYVAKKKGITKLTAAQFFSFTKVITKEAEHNARDAGMMVWQHPFKIFVPCSN